MINLKKASLLATIGGALLVPAAVFAADTVMPHETVKDDGGRVISSTNGNCVITKWTGKTDDCRAAVRDVYKLSKEQRTVYFDFNKSTLNTNEKAKLDSLAKAISASKAVSSVDIVGFADQIGQNDYNQALSKRRADTVKSYLAAKGLKTRKVRVEGMGESKPVTNCDMKEERSALISCLAADRRVEIELNFVK